MRFDRLGITFEYPDNWLVDAETPDDGLCVTVSSPDGAFWSVSGHAPSDDAEALADAVLGQMREEYRDLDSEVAVDTVAGHHLAGYDMNFSYLDLISTAQVRTFETPTALYVIFSQAEDHEWESVCRVFDAMTMSLVMSADSSSIDE